jgi:hypothetical protein
MKFISFNVQHRYYILFKPNGNLRPKIMRTSIKAAILFSIVILFLVPTVVTTFAYPPGNQRDHLRLFVEPILMGHGFALRGDQYHILDVNVIRMGDTSPGFIRSLLWKRKSPEEIAKEISDAQTSTRIRAYLRFAGEAYTLNVTGYDNQSLTADVLTMPQSGGTNQTNFIPTAAGHISLLMSKYEGDTLSTGTLTMNGTDYKVLLTSPMRLRWF